MMVTAPPPAVAVLVVDGETVCVFEPVVPRSQSPHRKPPLLAAVSVGAPLAELSADGLKSIEVLPPLFELSAPGSTRRELPDTVPDPRAFAFDRAKASPPSVLLLVLETALAVAGPLPLPVAVAVAAPPVAVPLVSEVALAGEPLTMPVPVADMPALTVVSPTAAVLDCVCGAAIVRAPPPASAVLLTLGVTVCVLFPVVPRSQSRTRKQPELARVVVMSPLALLVALGESLRLRSPALLELVA